MSLRKLSAIIAFASAALFSLLNFVPFFRLAEYRVYDFFLRFRPPRSNIDNVVLLDVDDEAIAKVGVFPWPRSVMAEGLLRLKEHGARLAVFDIEYIDKSPTQVDELYLKNDLARDYNRRFSEIEATVADVLNAVSSGSIPREAASAYINDVSALIAAERDSLFADTLRIARDDDLLLAQAAALFGNAWGTLNIQDAPLSGEQARRRSFAEEHFSYPVENSGGAAEGINADILTPVPLFAQAVRGAGYTNAVVDSDGVRRRIFLTQEVGGRWYLQLVFAPLVESWGSPAISLSPRRLVIDKPDGPITIPLDRNGAMLIDWPRENYIKSFSHISFSLFGLLAEYQANIEEYLSVLIINDSGLFPSVAKNAAALLEYFNMGREAKRTALEECSDEAFDEYVTLRDTGFEMTAQFLAALSEENYIENESSRIINAFSRNNNDLADAVMEEAAYCRILLGYIDTELQVFFSLNREIRQRLNDKICIIGRVDTGTTDIGVNPFHGEYVNVGTHAAVLDTILSNSFLTPLPFFWSVLFALLFVPFVLATTSGFGSARRFVLGAAGVVLSFALPLCLFIAKGIFLGLLGTVLAMAVAVILREVIAFSKSEHEKRFIRRAFSTYLSASVVEELIADPSKLNLGGEKREMTAVFTDIRGFSGISEQLDPVQLVRLLNKYLTTMSNIIMENQGTIDKYVGDTIIAFFGAPVYRADHALLACRSALAMKHAECELNAVVAAEGLSPAPIFTRIGINSGEMVVGNMGAENKMNYTVMGSAVNLAARLEGVNRQYRTGIMISEYTKEQAGADFLCRRLDRARVVGINAPVLLYELAGMTANAGETDLNFNKKWDEAITLFEKRRYTEAKELFVALAAERPGIEAAALYIDRCASFLKTPPAPDWDEIFSLSEK